MVAVRAHFDGKVIVLEEPVDLPRHQPLIVHIETPTVKPLKPGDSLRIIAENAIDDPSLPPDGSEQHDHYVHGSPKKP